jgi:orotidine-5'-phosphate decarboxylase
MNSSLIIALDFPEPEQALAFTQGIKDYCHHVKVGKTLFTRSGPSLIESLQTQGFKVFLDLKYHDIPNTVASACRVAADLGVWMLNVHASGGKEMLFAAREALDKYQSRPLLIAVTLLTSLNDQDLQTLGIQSSLQETVLRLARLAKTCGLDGVVCSPHEIISLRETLGTEFTLVTPGIRPVGTIQNDQKRIMTPAEALKCGANYLVIGRPIIASPKPIQALLEIMKTIEHN